MLQPLKNLGAALICLGNPAEDRHDARVAHVPDELGELPAGGRLPLGPNALVMSDVPCLVSVGLGQLPTGFLTIGTLGFSPSLLPLRVELRDDRVVLGLRHGI